MVNQSRQKEINLECLNVDIFSKLNAWVSYKLLEHGIYECILQFNWILVSFLVKILSQ